MKKASDKSQDEELRRASGKKKTGKYWLGKFVEASLDLHSQKLAWKEDRPQKKKCFNRRCLCSRERRDLSDNRIHPSPQRKSFFPGLQIPALSSLWVQPGFFFSQLF